MSSSPTTPGSKPTNIKQSPADDTMQPYTDEPVPSYEAALREGAGGGIHAGPSNSTPPPAPVHPSYGCSPYTPHGTARILIVPAPHAHHPQQVQTDAGLPLPASMQTTPGPRAKPRFFIALAHAIILYILLNLLVDLTVTRTW